MLRPDDLAQVVAIEIGGLRAFVVRRHTVVTLDLAVLTPHTSEQDPFFGPDDSGDWVLDEDPGIPALDYGFVFVGCQRGVLFALHTGAPSHDEIDATLERLAEWARKPWRPVDERDFRARNARLRADARARLLRRIAIALFVLYCLWALATSGYQTTCA